MRLLQPQAAQLRLLRHRHGEPVHGRHERDGLRVLDASRPLVAVLVPGPTGPQGEEIPHEVDGESDRGERGVRRGENAEKRTVQGVQSLGWEALSVVHVSYFGPDGEVRGGLDQFPGFGLVDGRHLPDLGGLFGDVVGAGSDVQRDCELSGAEDGGLEVFFGGFGLGAGDEQLGEGFYVALEVHGFDVVGVCRLFVVGVVE